MWVQLRHQCAVLLNAAFCSRQLVRDLQCPSNGLYVSPQRQHWPVLQAEQSKDKGQRASGVSKVGKTAAATETEDSPQDMEVSNTLEQVPAHNCDLSVAATHTLPGVSFSQALTQSYHHPPTSPGLYT